MVGCALFGRCYCMLLVVGTVQGQRVVTPIDAVVSTATGVTLRSQSHDVFRRSQIVTPVTAAIYYSVIGYGHSFRLQA